MAFEQLAGAATQRKTSQELQQELEEAERIAASLREQLEQAKWVADYDKAIPLV